MAHKILMLGGRRSGKSTILASIVYTLGQKSELFSVTDQTDYSVEKAVSLKAKRLEIENYLKQRKNIGGNSQFQVDFTGTKGELHYFLETQIHGASKVTFEFVDVPGETMEVTHAEHNALKAIIPTCDVFVIAIDTPYLMQDIDENINSVWNRVDEITDLLANIHIENEDIDRKLIILCPVKCEKWTQNNQADKVTERVCHAYKQLINNWAPHRAVDVWVMPIETAGGIVHTKLLDGYRLFNNENDRTGVFCSINDLTGQIMLKNGDIIASSKVYKVAQEPDPELKFDFTQIPLSWYKTNGKGFAPERCEQPAYHIFRFLVKKEEKASAEAKRELDETFWLWRWWKKIWSPPFGKNLKAYSQLIDELDKRNLIRTNGDGIRKIESIIK